MRVRRIIHVRLWKKYIESKIGVPTMHTANVTQLLSCSMKVVIWTPWKHGSCTAAPVAKKSFGFVWKWWCVYPLVVRIGKIMINHGLFGAPLFFRQTHNVCVSQTNGQTMFTSPMRQWGHATFTGVWSKTGSSSTCFPQILMFKAKKQCLVGGFNPSEKY